MQLCPPPSPVVQVPPASPGSAQQDCPLFLGQEWCWGLALGAPLTEACLGDPPKASGRQDLWPSSSGQEGLATAPREPQGTKATLCLSRGGGRPGQARTRHRPELVPEVSRCPWG